MKVRSETIRWSSVSVIFLSLSLFRSPAALTEFGSVEAPNSLQCIANVKTMRGKDSEWVERKLRHCDIKY